MELSKSSTDQLMAMAAHRYCLGRSSYIVSTCHEWIKATWAQMDTNTQGNMLRDTLEALHSGMAGPECHAADWRDIGRWMHDRMTPEQRQEVEDQTAWLATSVDAILRGEVRKTPERPCEP